MHAMPLAAAPSAAAVPLDQINAVALTGDMLVDAFAYAQGPVESRRARLERFAAHQRLKPPVVAAEALSVRMALLGALMDSCGIVEGEWLATCEAVARIRLEDSKNLPMPWGDAGVSYDEAQLQEMIWAFGEKQ
ncbi:hypothetical protein EWH08_11065 [Sphingobium indicum]|uniref:Uncharacterized protein n=2 Tax=Sphingobium indicum TaxID=332055 RepID=A0A4Q4J6L5_9SPHN|nr:hypothetical protein [Sphingobium indicum]NYI23081.1 hypothetical protein [Sphingobium indicum]RYM01842.1 hypothetical protein EWH08_11065 [Sphingobium indicum]